MARYEVVSGSVSGHCCFEASVVDTSRPLRSEVNEFTMNQVVCECDREEDAILVAEALNLSLKGFR